MRLYRYLPANSPDGLQGEESAFLAGSVWWAVNLVAGRRVQQRREELFEFLCARVNHVGLLAERIDSARPGQLPAGLSDIGLISTAVNLARHTPMEDR